MIDSYVMAWCLAGNSPLPQQTVTQTTDARERHHDSVSLKVRTRNFTKIFCLVFDILTTESQQNFARITTACCYSIAYVLVIYKLILRISSADFLSL